MDSELAHGLSECYIERERLRLGELITTGNFGEVRDGKLRMRNGSIEDVAVKSLKSMLLFWKYNISTIKEKYLIT